MTRLAEMLGILIAADENLDVGFLVHLLLGPFQNLFLGELLTHHDIGTVLADVDLGQVARGLGGVGSSHPLAGLPYGRFPPLESGVTKDDQDEHDADHAEILIMSS